MAAFIKFGDYHDHPVIVNVDEIKEIHRDKDNSGKIRTRVRLGNGRSWWTGTTPEEFYNMIRDAQMTLDEKERLALMNKDM